MEKGWEHNMPYVPNFLQLLNKSMIMDRITLHAFMAELGIPTKFISLTQKPMINWLKSSTHSKQTAVLTLL